MKKKIKIISLIVGIVIIGIICFKNISFGKTIYKIPNSNVNLEVPKLSFFKKDCCMFSSTFKSFRSKLSLQKELDKMIDSYEKRTCNNKPIYYNKDNDITITGYGVNSEFIMNSFYINYDKGEFDNNDCSVVTDPTKLKYSIKSTANNYNNICVIPEKFTYKNKNGEIYDVYYECFGDLLFQTGLGNMNFLNYMLSYGWISMQDIIDFLEYQTNKKEATKTIFDDEGFVLYKNKDFSLLKCDTIDDNQDIYIKDTNFEYEKNICK